MSRLDWKLTLIMVLVFIFFIFTFSKICYSESFKVSYEDSNITCEGNSCNSVQYEIYFDSDNSKKKIVEEKEEEDSFIFGPALISIEEVRKKEAAKHKIKAKHKPKKKKKIIRKKVKKSKSKSKAKVKKKRKFKVKKSKAKTFKALAKKVVKVKKIKKKVVKKSKLKKESKLKIIKPVVKVSKPFAKKTVKPKKKEIKPESKPIPKVKTKLEVKPQIGFVPVKKSLLGFDENLTVNLPFSHFSRKEKKRKEKPKVEKKESLIITKKEPLFFNDLSFNSLYFTNTSNDEKVKPKTISEKLSDCQKELDICSSLSQNNIDKLAEKEKELEIFKNQLKLAEKELAEKQEELKQANFNLRKSEKIIFIYKTDLKREERKQKISFSENEKLLSELEKSKQYSQYYFLGFVIAVFFVFILSFCVIFLKMKYKSC